MDAYPDVNFRYYIMPSRDLPGLVPLDFNRQDLEETIAIGKSDAEYVVQNKIFAIDVLNGLLTPKNFIYV